jgi:membrane fusion protein (multidrug efflux system)
VSHPQPTGPEASEKPARGFKPKKLILPVILLAGLGTAGWYGLDWYHHGRFIISTDDAYVRADMTIMAAKVPGYVLDVPVRDNALVHAGDILARLDDGDYRLAVAAAKAKLATHEATLARIDAQIAAQEAVVLQTRSQKQVSRADTQRAAAALQRVQALARADFASQAAYETALADRERNIAQIDQATAAIVAAEAQVTVLKAQRAETQQGRAELTNALEKAERDLSFTVIRAPIDGVVGNRAVQVGQYVQTGVRLLGLVSSRALYIEANLKETQLNRIYLGQSATIIVDAQKNHPLVGIVESISPASGATFSLLPPENATGNFTKIVQRIPVRIALDPQVVAEGWLRPGLSVEVDLKEEPGKAPVRLGDVATLPSAYLPTPAQPIAALP